MQTRPLADQAHQRTVSAIDQATYSTTTAARFVGVHPRTLERWREDGTLRPSHRTARGYYRYTLRQLEPLRREYGDRAERSPAFPWNGN